MEGGWKRPDPKKTNRKKPLFFWIFPHFPVKTRIDLAVTLLDILHPLSFAPSPPHTLHTPTRSQPPSPSFPLLPFLPPLLPLSLLFPYSPTFLFSSPPPSSLKSTLLPSTRHCPSRVPLHFSTSSARFILHLFPSCRRSSTLRSGAGTSAS